MVKSIKRIVVTGAAGQIAYHLLFRIANGELFGKEQFIELQLLDLPEMMKALEGLQMELEDCAFPLLQKITIGSDPYEIFEGATHAFLIGAKPRGPNMERKDLLSENGKIFIEQGRALNGSAEKNVKVLVVGNPCNTNAWIVMQNAKDLPKANIHAMTRLDQNRARVQLAKKAGVLLPLVQRMTIWGNHSSTQVPDYMHATIEGRPASDVIKDDEWLKNVFISLVQERGAAVIAARGKSSAASAAHAALEAMYDICHPTVGDGWYSSCIWSEGNPYHIDPQLIFSFPCRTNSNGTVEIIAGLTINDFLEEKLKITESELIDERELVSTLIGRMV